MKQASPARVDASLSVHPEVTILVEQFKADYQDAVELFRSGATKLLAAAQLLTRIRDMCPRGTWGPVQEQLGLDRGRVERLLKLGSHALSLKVYVDQWGDMSQDAMLKLIDASKDVELATDPLEAAFQMKAAADTAKAKRAAAKKEYDHFAALKKALAEFEDAALGDPDAAGTLEGLELLRRKFVTISNSLKDMQTIDMESVTVGRP